MTTKTKVAASVLAILAAATALFVLDSSSDKSFYTLYRNSVLDEGMRLHVATFDSADGEPYNRENCSVVTQLMQSQEGVKTRFWCEKGRFRR